MMQNEKLIGFNGKLSVCLPLVIAEFNFIGIVQRLYYRAYLTSDQIMFGQIREQCYYIEQVRFFMCAHRHDLT